MRNYATWIRPTYRQPEGPAQRISTSVTKEDCIQLKKKIHSHAEFFFVLSKTHIRVYESVGQKLLKNRDICHKKTLSPL